MIEINIKKKPDKEWNSRVKSVEEGTLLQTTYSAEIIKKRLKKK